MKLILQIYKIHTMEFSESSKVKKAPSHFPGNILPLYGEIFPKLFC